MKMTLADISPTAALLRRLHNEANSCRVVWRKFSRKELNRRRVADYFDRLNAQGIALGGK